MASGRRYILVCASLVIAAVASWPARGAAAQRAQATTAAQPATASQPPAGAQGAAAAPAASATQAPSVLETALAAFACDPQGNKPLDADRYQCVDDRIAGLRADFGYDLGRLSAADRQEIDRSCGSMRASAGRDTYIPCVSGKLTTLRARRSPKQADAAAASGAAADARAETAAVRAQALGTALPLGVAVVASVGAAALAAFGRLKAARHRCRTCGGKVPPPTDLCGDCRKKAAEAIRQAAAERAERERDEQDEQRRLELEQEERAREEEFARLRREHEERARAFAQEQLIREREEAERAAAAAAGATPASDSDEDIFDPYTVLGIPWDVSHDKLVTAYEEARSKYDPDLVAHLGDEVQAHYRTKAEAVERAYQMLTAR